MLGEVVDLSTLFNLCMLAIILTSSPTLTKLSSRRKRGLSADRHVRVVFLVGRGGGAVSMLTGEGIRESLEDIWP